MQSKKTLQAGLFILAAGVMALPITGHAQNVYIGASAGQSSVDEPGLKDEDTGFKIYGGYQVTDFIGLELGYVDHGKVTQGASQLEVDGLTAAVVGTVPLSPIFALHARAGAFAWDLTAQGPIAAGFTDSSNVDAFYGAGASVQLDANWSAVAEWERYEVESADVDLLSVGVRYRF